MERILSHRYNINFGHRTSRIAKYFRPVNWYNKPNTYIPQEEIDKFFLEIKKIKSEFDSKENNVKILNPKIQRSLDIVLASLLAVPAVLAIVIASSLVKIAQKDMPTFHKQERYGFNDKSINIYKIRTIRKTKDGWRQASGFARMLRKYSIDELPQIWNVFKGEMSFMGPRPVSFRDLREISYDNGMEFIMQRLSVKPGFGFGYQKGRKYAKPRTEMEKDFLEDRGFKTYLKTIKSLFLTVLKGNNE